MESFAAAPVINLSAILEKHGNLKETNQCDVCIGSDSIELHAFSRTKSKRRRFRHLSRGRLMFNVNEFFSTEAASVKLHVGR